MTTSVQYLYWGEQSPQQFVSFRVENMEISDRDVVTIESIAERKKNSPVVLLVPSKYILLTEVALPTRNSQKIRQLLPYALEERLTEDVDNLHFAIDKIDRAGHCGVAVVKRSKMVAWLKPFDDAGIALSQLLPDIVTLPVGEGEASIAIGEHQTLLRLSMREGYALPPEAIVSLANEALFEKEDAPALLKIYLCDESQQLNLSGLNIEYELISCDGGIEHHAAQQLSKPQPLNLLQGEFNRKQQLWHHLKPWRAAAALLLSVLLLQGVGSMIENQHLEDMEQQLQGDIEKLYRDTFPTAQKVINPRLQMEQKLKALMEQQGGGDFSYLMVTAAPVVTGNKIELLRYKENGLEFDIEMKDIPALDRLKEQLTSKGLEATIQNASSTGKIVTGRIAITRGAL